MKTVELKDGTEALIDGDAINVKQIRWKKDGTYYSIMLIKAPKIEKEFTIDDVVRTANSMEY
jgi:translation elongation factor P/translation initiation factor 5A